jgi:hypothetical protein
MELETELIVTLIGLHVLSWGYDALIGWLERRGYHDGYVSFFVVIGVTYTILATTWLIGIDAVLTLLLAFVASGSPMVLGSIARHLTERKREEDQLRDHARRLNGKGGGDEC